MYKEVKRHEVNMTGLYQRLEKEVFKYSSTGNKKIKTEKFKCDKREKYNKAEYVSSVKTTLIKKHSLLPSTYCS